MKHKFHFQSGQYQEENKKQKTLKVSKVLRFLKDNPLSTSKQVYDGAGIGVSIAESYVRAVMYNGERCYRINHKKLRGL